jgi:two-component system, chemotaxis family, CheB/CheR fusion protein
LVSTVERVNTFFESILASIRSAVVVVDRSNKVQFWNHRCAELWGLRGDEVQGQDFFALDIGLPVAELKQPLEQLRDRINRLEDLQIQSLNRRGFTSKCRVRMMELMDADGHILLIDEVK